MRSLLLLLCASLSRAAAAAGASTMSLENYEVRLLSRDDGSLAELPMSALSPRNQRVSMRTV